MDIHTIRMELRTKSIYDLPLRVTYYARVSSESDEQLNSLGNQVSYYEDLIRRNLRGHSCRGTLTRACPVSLRRSVRTLTA